MEARQRARMSEHTRKRDVSKQFKGKLGLCAMPTCIHNNYLRQILAHPTTHHVQTRVTPPYLERDGVQLEGFDELSGRLLQVGLGGEHGHGVADELLGVRVEAEGRVQRLFFKNKVKMKRDQQSRLLQAYKECIVDSE